MLRLQQLQHLASVVVAPEVYSLVSVFLAHGLNLPCGIFLNQGLNPCLLQWQADSLPLSHQGSPISVQFSSVTHSHPTLCYPVNCSTPGLPVHQLLDFTQIHIHRVGDAIQPSHPLSSPSPPAPNLSQHQSLFQ